MLGKPKFRQEDQVTFRFTSPEEDVVLDGVIYVVDPNGTEEQKEEVSYDIQALYKGEVILFKHVPESCVKERA